MSNKQMSKNSILLGNLKRHYVAFAAHPLTAEKSLKSAVRHIEELEGALNEAREYFDQRADGEQEVGDVHPTCNEEMDLLTKIDEVLK